MPAPARVAAHQGLLLIESADLGDTLARTRDPLSDSRDRALATDLITGTLRWRGALDYQLARMSGRPLARLDDAVVAALRVAAYQLLYRERIPVSAIVNDSVEIVKAARLKSAAPFVNAVLRRLARERDALEWPSRGDVLAHLSTIHSHPGWLVARWIERFGVDIATQWLMFNNEMPALTLATNRALIDRVSLMDALRREGITTADTTVAPHGIQVSDGKPLTSVAFKRGECLVQDEASQLIPELVGARQGEAILDACAAPGGKTVALAGQIRGRGVIVATDVRPRRVRALSGTLARCRITNAAVVQIATTGPLPFTDAAFDRVLVDAPCSGLGILRRDPDIKWKRSADDLTRFAQSQTDLLRRLAPLVRRGGRLVYSTCSSEPEENEQVVSAFLADAPDFVSRPLSALEDVPGPIRALATADGYLRTDPARDHLEAFFGAVLERLR